MRDLTVTVTFAATHLDTSREGPHEHGHTFHVRAHELGSDAGVRLDLLPDLRAIVDELHLHRLRDMLTGGRETLDGIGAWIMERLVLRHPRLLRIEVWTADEPEIVVGVSREIR